MKLHLHKKNLLRRLNDRHATKPADLPARDAVFATAELLELILLLLDSRTLLVSAQRVCTSWRDVIGGSFRLQNVLFLREPRAHLTPSLEPSAAPEQRQFHPLLQAAFGPLFREGLDASGSAYQSQAQAKQQRYWMFGMDGMVAMHLPIADTSSRHSKHKAFVRRGASWRNMHVCQPPIHRVGYIRQRPAAILQDQKQHPQSQNQHRQSFSSTSSAGSGQQQQQQPHQKSQILTFPEGLRMGQFYDLLDGIVWGSSGRGGTDRGRHYAWVSWDPARTAGGLLRQRDLGAVQRVVGEWVDLGEAEAGAGVDIVIGEEASVPFSAKCDFYNVLNDVEERVQDAAWMFRCKDFRDPCLAMEA
jgi:hypothetical protein